MEYKKAWEYEKVSALKHVDTISTDNTKNITKQLQHDIQLSTYEELENEEDIELFGISEYETSKYNKKKA